MYRSHPVRRLCEDPAPEGTVTLVVELVDGDDTDTESLSRAVTELGGHLEAENRFSYCVSLPRTAVADLCDRDDLLARVETANTISLGLDHPAGGADGRDGGGEADPNPGRGAHRD